MMSMLAMNTKRRLGRLERKIPVLLVFTREECLNRIERLISWVKEKEKYGLSEEDTLELAKYGKWKEALLNNPDK